MQITKESQLILGNTYYYEETNSPKLEHQPDGVAIYSCVWKDIAEEYKKNYGFSKKKMLAFSTTKIELFVGRIPNNHQINTYMEIGWIHNKKFFTTIEETYPDLIQQTFEYYTPFEVRNK